MPCLFPSGALGMGPVGPPTKGPGKGQGSGATEALGGMGWVDGVGAAHGKDGIDRAI